MMNNRTYFYYRVLLIAGVLHGCLQCVKCKPGGETLDTKSIEEGADEDKSIIQKREMSKPPTSLNMPGDVDPCSLPQSKGNCKAKFIRYYYDDLQKNCIAFTYSGCGLNENNFMSLNDCEKACVMKRMSRKIVKANKYKQMNAMSSPDSKLGSEYNSRRKFPGTFCKLQRDNGIICPGIKRGNYLDQFYFDDERNRCVKFIYNGCGGNANRFNSIWECTMACGRKPNLTKYK